MICLTGSCTKVLKSRKLTVHNNLTVVKVHRTCKTAYASRSRRHLFFISKGYGIFRNVQCIDQLGHIELPVSADKYGYVSVFIPLCIICHKQKGLDCLLLVQLEVLCNLVNGLGARSVYLF